MNEFERPLWHVAYTYPNSEKKVYKLLREKDIEVFLPLHKTVRQWSDRKKKMEVPLFPNYIFLKVAERNRGNALTTYGIVRFLSFDGKFSTVSETEIDTIKKVINGDYDLSVETSFAVGDKVRIVFGSLSGMEGVLINTKGQRRFVVKLQGIDKVLSLNIPAQYMVHA